MAKMQVYPFIILWEFHVLESINVQKYIPRQNGYV